MRIARTLTPSRPPRQPLRPSWRTVPQPSKGGDFYMAKTGDYELAVDKTAYQSTPVAPARPLHLDNMTVWACPPIALVLAMPRPGS